ncbi:hypothetical protein BDV18DRAFT_140215 [Aspergillus unguis]
MSASHTTDAPEGAADPASPAAEITSQSREDPTMTAETQKEETTQKPEDDKPLEEKEEGETKESQPDPDAPPLPDEVPPPLPNEAPPGQDRTQGEDDGWEPVWDANAQSYYFYNRYTGVSQWENPRVPHADTAAPPAPGTVNDEPGEEEQEKVPAPLGGYNPAIHGDYDPTAPYAQHYERQEEEAQIAAPGLGATDPNGYGAVGSFNRFTGRWQGESQNPEYHNDENKSKRQMNAYFDVDAAANAHDGRSLRAERSAKKLSKKELKAFKDKRREKKEEKRRAWLRD